LRPGAPRRVVSLPRALSKLGLCSRTQALERIASGLVSVNGRISKDPSLRVALEVDSIVVDGKAARPTRESIVIALHKPKGYVTTRSDPQGRPTVYELLPELDRFVFPVGRLDKDTTGLLILTDDHRLGEALTNPKGHVSKTYEVVVDQPPDEAALLSLRQGLDIGRGERTLPARVNVLADGPGEITLTISLREGKNRQIRRMLAAVGLKVLALTRTGIGGLVLGPLPSGSHRRLTRPERERLLKVAAET
jgi:23S rRNA pseudouridine2605 synthase